MKSLKQDLVGFHWSAFFEPRLPFTRVPVKLPLPHLLSLSLSLSFLSLFDSPLPPLPPLSSPAHPPVYILSNCNGKTVSPCSLFPPLPSLVTSDLLTSSVFRYILSPSRLGCRRSSKPPPFFLPHTPASSPTTITKSIPLSTCKASRGPFFFVVSLFPILRGEGDD